MSLTRHQRKAAKRKAKKRKPSYKTQEQRMVAADRKARQLSPTPWEPLCMYVQRFHWLMAGGR